MEVYAIVITRASQVLAVPPYGQCGGQGYTGSTQCDSGTVCVKLNDWYSQCQPGAAPTSAPTSTVTTVAPTAPTTTTTAPTGTAVAPAPSIPAGQLTRLTANFGANPKNVGIYVYKPSNVKNNPGLLLALHGCGGTAQQFFSGSQFRQQADQRGFLVIYGSAANDMNCWDVTSTASLTHDGGGDSLGLANAVRYALTEWGVDREKVFVTGFSSGAMMTNVMAGTYPDLFKGGAPFAGVAMGCLSKGNAPVFPPDLRSNDTPSAAVDANRLVDLSPTTVPSVVYGVSARFGCVFLRFSVPTPYSTSSRHEFRQSFYSLIFGALSVLPRVSALKTGIPDINRTNGLWTLRSNYESLHSELTFIEPTFVSLTPLDTPDLCSTTVPPFQAHERVLHAPSGIADDSQSLNQTSQSAYFKAESPYPILRVPHPSDAVVEKRILRTSVKLWVDMDANSSGQLVDRALPRIDYGESGFRGVCQYKGETPFYVTIFEPQTACPSPRYGSTASSCTLLSVNRGDEEQDIQEAIEAATGDKCGEVSIQFVRTAPACSWN
ncbi:hypothetical protein NMY22_g8421 [Coprinellus aureogranulatus]|nr:hypothetical protein NMY22_g8421 [Coprinellus aureogranulatus]